MSKRGDNVAIRGCSELVVGFGVALLACLLISLCGCKAQRVVERVEVPVVVTQEHTIESVKVDHVRDTLIQRDSIYHYIKGDTVLIERWHYLQGSTKAVRVDTLIKVDSVEVPVVTTKVVTKTEQVEKPLHWWQRALMLMGGLALIAGALWVAIKARKI